MPTDAKAAAGLVEQAVDSLRRLQESADDTGVYGQVADDFERMWELRPLTAGVVGVDRAARVSFLNLIIGSALLDPTRSEAPAQVLRVEPAGETRCLVRLRDGSVEEFKPGDVDPAVMAHAAASHERVEEGRSELDSRRAQLEMRKMALPPVLREVPPKWAFWLWLWRWILSFFYKTETLAIREAESAVHASRARLDEVSGGSHPVAPRDFAQRVRDLIDPNKRGVDVERVVLEVTGCQLSEGIAVDDVPDGLFEKITDRVDGWFWVGAAKQEPPGEYVGLGRMYVVGTTTAPFQMDGLQFRRAGDSDHAINSMGRLLSVERALRIARGVSQRLETATAELEATLAQKEQTFADRLESLQSRRIANPSEYVSKQLARIHPLVVEQVHGLLQRESEWATQRLDKLTTGWSAQVTAAESSEDIRDALAIVESNAGTELQMAGEEIAARIRDGVRKSIAELHDRSLTELRRISPPAEKAIPLVPSPPEIALSIVTRPPETLGPPPGRLASLFKSKKKMRAEICERIENRAKALRDMTVSDLLDTEPVLGRLLTEFVKASLSAAVREHDRWLSGAIVEERRAIEKERAALAPVRQARDVAKADAERLLALATQTEAALPPVIA